LRRTVYLDPGHYEALCHLALLAEREGHVREAALFRQRAARVLERGSRTAAQTSR
jgi:chemotaxis protein methyltransferase WspC